MGAVILPQGGVAPCPQGRQIVHFSFFLPNVDARAPDVSLPLPNSTPHFGEATRRRVARPVDHVCACENLLGVYSCASCRASHKSTNSDRPDYGSFGSQRRSKAPCYIPGWHGARKVLYVILPPSPGYPAVWVFLNSPRLIFGRYSCIHMLGRTPITPTTRPTQSSRPVFPLLQRLKSNLCVHVAQKPNHLQVAHRMFGKPSLLI